MLALVRRSQKFRPTADPLPGGAGRPKFNSAGDGHYLYLQTQFGEDWCMQFRVIVVTDPQTNTHTNRPGRLQYTSLACSVITNIHHEWNTAVFDIPGRWNACRSYHTSIDSLHPVMPRCCYIRSGSWLTSYTRLSPRPRAGRRHPININTYVEQRKLERALCGDTDPWWCKRQSCSGWQYTMGQAWIQIQIQ